MASLQLPAEYLQIPGLLIGGTETHIMAYTTNGITCLVYYQHDVMVRHGRDSVTLGGLFVRLSL